MVSGFTQQLDRHTTRLIILGIGIDRDIKCNLLSNVNHV